jgi:SAM-dependent methyltransferase
MSNEAWDTIYSTNESSRYKNEGDIGIYYRLPKFVQLFQAHFPTINGLNILEIGSGLGEIYDLIVKSYVNDSFNYTLTEYSPSAIKALKNKYPNKNDIFQADATSLSFVSGGGGGGTILYVHLM